MAENELMHYGKKGMKWGVRLYQNKDGTLTSLGKKRYNKEFAKLKAEQTVVKNKLRTQAKLKKLDDMKTKLEKDKAELDAAKTQASSDKKSNDVKKIKLSDMSNEELKAVYDRLKLEKDIKDLMPKQVSKGKRFVDTIVTDMAGDAAKDIGKQLMKTGMASAVNQMLDLEGDDKVYANNKKK